MHERTAGRVVAGYEVVGGIIGLIVAIQTAVGLLGHVAPTDRLAAVALVGAAAAAFATVLGAGVMLAAGHQWGRRLSAAIQIAQIPLWAFGPTRWLFTAGAYLAVRATVGDGAAITVGTRAGFDVPWGGQAGLPAFVGVNVAPLAVLAMLWWSTMARAVAADPAGAAADAPAA